MGIVIFPSMIICLVYSAAATVLRYCSGLSFGEHGMPHACDLAVENNLKRPWSTTPGDTKTFHVPVVEVYPSDAQRFFVHTPCFRRVQGNHGTSSMRIGMSPSYAVMKRKKGTTIITGPGGARSSPTEATTGTLGNCAIYRPCTHSYRKV